MLDAYKEAKKADGLNVDDKELFSRYEKAYAACVCLEEIFDNVEEDANFLKRKAMFKDILALLSFVIGVAGLVTSFF